MTCPETFNGIRRVTKHAPAKAGHSRSRRCDPNKKCQAVEHYGGSGDGMKA